MQVSQFQTIKDKLVSSVIPQYAVAIGESVNLEAVRTRSEKLLNQIADIVFPEHRLILKVGVEPQSEQEESKDERDFVKTLTKEGKKFEEAVKNYEIAQLDDIQNLTKIKENQQHQIELLGRHAGDFSQMFIEIVKQTDIKLGLLEKEINQTRLITCQILTQIKAIF